MLCYFLIDWWVGPYNLMYFIVILFSSNCLLNRSHKQLLGSKDPDLFDRILGIFHIEHHKKLTCFGVMVFFFFFFKARM